MCLVISAAARAAAYVRAQAGLKFSALTLHKLMRMGSVIIIAAIYLTGTDYLDQLLALGMTLLQLTHLYGSCMRTQQLLRYLRRQGLQRM